MTKWVKTEKRAPAFEAVGSNLERKHSVLHLLFLVFFFVSGACGLIYEVAWLRVMGLVFGNTTQATGTILAGYMAGLGLGALFFGRCIDRTSKHPILVYAWLEGGVGIYAFCTPWIWKGIDFVQVSFYRALEPSFLQVSVFKFAVAFLTLFIPTFLMGGTLPVISKYFVRGRQTTAKWVGLLYALNTLGAVVGVLSGGLFLLSFAGVAQTVVFTGVFNLILCAVCTFVVQNELTGPVPGPPSLLSPAPARRLSEENGAPTSGETSGSFRAGAVSFVLLFSFAISGGVSMMYEVAWTRTLAIVLGSSIYAFSVMLATFLLGIALGSYLLSVAGRWFTVDLATFSILQMSTAIFALVGFNQFGKIPYAFAQFFGWFKDSVWNLELVNFFLCAIVMFPPTFCIGAMFACFIHIFQRSEASGKEIGTAYFSNTIGALLGSTLTGFIIIPRIGIQNTLLLAAGLNACIGIATYFFHPKRFQWKYAAAAGAVFCLLVLSALWVEAWDTHVITSGTAVKPQRIAGISKRDFLLSAGEKLNLFYREGLSSTVSVDRLNDVISLSVNGKIDASTDDRDSFTEYFLGHLPMLLVPDAKKVLVIGVGSGATMAAVAAYPVEQIHGVEIEEAVIEGAKFFSQMNRNVLEDPRTKLFINDGRNFLLVHPEPYDVIISEPSNPWMAGVANLFSYEHFQTMSRRLRPGGVVCQWFHAYNMSPEDLGMIIRTFGKVFQYTSLWTSLYPDLMLIGSNQPHVPDFASISKAFDNPIVQKDLSPFGMRKPEGLFASFWMGGAELEKLSETANVNSDNYPRLEFSAPKSLYRDTTQENFVFLNSFKQSLVPEILHVEPPVEKNSRFFAEMARGFVAKRMFAQAHQALELAQRIDANDAGIPEIAGILNYYEDALDGAEQNLFKAIATGKASSEAYFYLGITLRKKARFSEAITTLSRAVELEPQNFNYLFELAEAYREAKQYEPALKTYDQVVKLKGSHFESLNRMAEILTETGSVPQQVSISQLILKNYPRYADAYVRLGKTF